MSRPEVSPASRACDFRASQIAGRRGAPEHERIRSSDRGYIAHVVANRIGHAGLVGWRAKAGRSAAEWLGARTPLDTQTLTTLVGVYLFVSRTRRMAQMLTRLRSG